MNIEAKLQEVLAKKVKDITLDKTATLESLGLDNMKYVPSAKFGKNLYRHLRFKYPFEIFGY